MSVVLDILRSYRTPCRVLRERIGTKAREDRAFATLMAACFLMFIAQWPRLSREGCVDNSIALELCLTGALFGWVLLAPLAMYFLAALSHAVLKLAGSNASGYHARMALFWAFLASSPLWLLSGLVRGFLGQTTVSMIVSIVALGGFLVIWLSGLAELGGHGDTGAV